MFFKQSLLTMFMAAMACLALPAYAQHRTAVVFRFAVQSESAQDAPALSLQACAQDTGAAQQSTPKTAGPDSAASSNAATVDPKVLDVLSNELQKGLSQKGMSVIVGPDPNTIPVGSLIITGCISNAKKGSAAGRMVGMGLGASQLGAHVLVLSKAETGFSPVSSRDLQVKGRTLLPPAGPAGVAVHAVREPLLTIPADAKKLAHQILEKIDW
jgi:hypothetical protein